jgi:phosphatidylglycerophosphate synthase
VVTIRAGVVLSLAALVVLLAVLGASLGIGLMGWATGLTVGSVLGVAVARSAARERVGAFGPADLVTLVRGTMSCGIAALVADSFVQDTGAVTVVVLATVALGTDAVDGRVARRTGTESRFGGRLDGEADAFLMLVLSVYVARSAGMWVLAIGSLRYLFGASGWLLPWMRAQLPPRYWRKVVTATAGIALTFAAADVAPPASTYAVLIVALILLVESFGRDVWWLWGHRRVDISDPGAHPTPVRLSSP